MKEKKHDDEHWPNNLWRARALNHEKENGHAMGRMRFDYSLTDQEMPKMRKRQMIKIDRIIHGEGSHRQLSIAKNTVMNDAGVPSRRKSCCQSQEKSERHYGNQYESEPANFKAWIWLVSEQHQLHMVFLR